MEPATNKQASKPTTLELNGISAAKHLFGLQSIGNLIASDCKEQSQYFFSLGFCSRLEEKLGNVNNYEKKLGKLLITVELYCHVCFRITLPQLRPHFNLISFANTIT